MRRTDWCLQQHYGSFRLFPSSLCRHRVRASTNHSCCKCHARTECSALTNLINLRQQIWETVKWKSILLGSSKTPAIYNPWSHRECVHMNTLTGTVGPGPAEGSSGLSCLHELLASCTRPLLLWINQLAKCSSCSHRATSSVCVVDVNADDVRTWTHEGQIYHISLSWWIQ